MIVDARPAAPGDLPRVADLARALRAELAALRGGALWAAREARPEPLDGAFATLAGRPEARILVGTIDGVVVGIGVVEVETLRDGRRLARVGELYVEPAAREVGVGEALARGLVDHAARLGCVGLDAVVLPGHRAGKNFFEAHGFTARQIVAHRPLGSRR